MIERARGSENTRLLNSLETKDARQIAAYAKGMMTIDEQSKFNFETDLAAIPLDTDDE